MIGETVPTPEPRPEASAAGAESRQGPHGESAARAVDRLSERVFERSVEPSINASIEPSIEIGGRDGPEPTRYGDWEKNGRCIDF